MRNPVHRFVLSFCMLSLFGLQSHAQQWTTIDPSKCYSQLLQRTDIYKNNDQLKLALLSTVNEGVLDQIKLDHNVTAMYEGIPFTDGWGAFKNAQRNYFEQHRLNVDHESATFMASISLDPQAAQIFDSCVSALGKGAPYGLAGFGTTEDELTATVQLFWSPTSAGQPIKVLDSTVTNAVVTDGEKYKGKLFPGVVSFNDARTITLTRLSPNRQITITLVTEPGVKMTPIRIPPVPPLYNCELKEFDHDPVTNAGFVWSDSFVEDEKLQPGHRGRCGDLWRVTKEVDGIVISVLCTLGPGDHHCLEDESGNGGGVNTPTATCTGSKDGATRSMRMRVTWQKTLMKCTPIPWAEPPKPVKTEPSKPAKTGDK